MSPCCQKISLHSLPLRNSHSAQVQVSSSHFENHTDSTSILIYLALTKMNQWAFWTCHRESRSFIKQLNAVFILPCFARNTLKRLKMSATVFINFNFSYIPST